MDFNKYLSNLGASAHDTALRGIDGSTLSSWKAVAQSQGLTLEEWLSSRVGMGSVSAMNAGGGNTLTKGFDGAVAATLTLNIQRASVAGTDANLGSLPAFIGLPQNRDNDYQSIFGEFTASGITLTVARTANNLVLTYSNGVDTSTITISARDTAYNRLLSGLANNYIDVQMSRYSVPSGSLNQLSELFAQVVDTPFGKRERNDMTPARFRKPTNQQADIVDITQGMKLGNYTGLVNNVAAGVTGEISLTLFVSEFIRPAF